MKKKAKKSKEKVKFTVKETKEWAAFGASLGIMSMIAIVVLLYLTFINGGQASISYAFAGFLVCVFSVLGLILSILCLADDYQHHLQGWIGLAANGTAVLLMAGILYLGGF